MEARPGGEGHIARAAARHVSRRAAPTWLATARLQRAAAEQHSTATKDCRKTGLIVSNPETDQRRRNLTLKPKHNIHDLQQLCSQRFKRLQTLTAPLSPPPLG